MSAGKVYVGIDVAKGRLDVAWGASGGSAATKRPGRPSSSSGSPR